MDTTALLDALDDLFAAELEDITRLLDSYGDAPSLLRMQARIVGALATIDTEAPE